MHTGGSTQFVVVKFTACYNTYAHRLLEGRFAPKLHGCYDVWGDGELKMVVMDRVVDAKPLYHELEHSLPSNFFEEIEEAISILHKENYVHGDVRETNIIVVEMNGVKHPQLIDYDTVGKDSEDKYGFSINVDLCGSELDNEVRRGGRMRKEHDLTALKYLRDTYEIKKGV